MTNAVRFVPTFLMPSEYERQVLEARRRRRMAEMLEAQAYEPPEGGVAPIPTAAPLVQGLQSFLTARQLRKAEEAEARAEEIKNKTEQQREQQITETGIQIAGRLVGGPPVRNVAAPDSTGLNEVAIRSQYIADPQDALRIAMMTPIGREAVQRNPVLAAKLAELLKTPESKTMEFGGKLLNVSGGQATPVMMGGEAVTAPSTTEATLLAKLIAERDALPQNDPRRRIYDDAIAKETTRPSAPVTNVYSTTAVAGVDEQGNPVFFQPTRMGGQPSIIEGVRPAPKGMNEGQAKAAGFADRIFEANPVFEQGAIPFESAMASQLPLGMGNYALTPQEQSFLQAERNFINAVLRRESGAVISDEEFKNARQQYIPQPGDSAQVISQKKRNRETVLNSLARDAGPSYKLPASSMQGSGFGEAGGWGQAEVIR